MWSADSPFGPHNLPYGVFRHGGRPPRIGVRIGDSVLDLDGAEAADLVLAGGALRRPVLNEFLALGRPQWTAVRHRIAELVTRDEHRAAIEPLLVPLAEVELLLPFAVGDYVDFYSSEHHAMNVGRIFRPDNPALPPNWKHLPIGYHGRAGTVVVSGTPVVRPSGQRSTPEGPVFGPSIRLDIEAEVGFVVGLPSNHGEPVPPSRFAEHVFGVVLVNDWSARDIQAWEYQPLGPFLAKSFATTVSPWVVTLEALAPYRCPAFERAPGDPKPLPYLSHDDDHGYDIEVGMHLRTAKMKAPARLSRASFRHSYWTVAQMVAHQSSNGCNLQPGDLLGSGTISGPTPDSCGSMMELTQAGKSPVALPGGETRSFLEDGDEVIERATCARSGYATIGFGEASGRITG
jgi:fumarylacetoacetase